MKLYLLLICAAASNLCIAQKKFIAITIDDVPNTRKFQEDGFKPTLLNLLDSAAIPFTIFINEGKVFGPGSADRNKELLRAWVANQRSTPGNHTYSHIRYSAVSAERFVDDLGKGEILTRQYADENKKVLQYFRFPYNDLGKDSLQHHRRDSIFRSIGYRIAPFTVESGDWMYNAVYRYYLQQGQTQKALEVGERYVEKTMALLHFMDSLSNVRYGRSIRHIYLCHDNKINTDYLPVILQKLTDEHYEVISFDDALNDPLYNQADQYYQKWGISWLYRWMESQQERMRWMKKEPGLVEIEKLYGSISN